MKTLISILVMVAAVVPSFSQVAAPVEVLDGGVAAVNELGRQFVLGKFQAAYERMNPQWRKRLAVKLGGEEKLMAQCEAIGKQLAKNATTLISMSATGFPTIYEVAPGKKSTMVAGKTVEALYYTKWLMVVPTVARYRIIGQDGIHVIESKSFQVAVSDKAKLGWSFIDGGTTSVAELRTVFISLPMNMKLPVIDSRRVEK